MGKRHANNRVVRERAEVETVHRRSSGDDVEMAQRLREKSLWVSPREMRDARHIA